MGNAMEMAEGISYACATQQFYLPDGHKMAFPNQRSNEGAELWCKLWPLFQELGTRPQSPLVRYCTPRPCAVEVPVAFATTRPPRTVPAGLHCLLLLARAEYPLTTTSAHG
jgi:hypothetical protein